MTGTAVTANSTTTTAPISNHLLELDFCLFKRTLLSYLGDPKSIVKGSLYFVQ
jgi:hypothetical protein